MPFVPFLVLVALPLIELALLIKLGQSIGFWHTILIILATGLAGTYVLRQQGFNALERAAAAVEAGETPMRPVLDGALLIIAGIMLILPGPLTDICGLLLLLPPLRALVARMLLSRLDVVERSEVKIFRWGKRRGDDPGRQRGRDVVIDGEFQRLDEKTAEPRPPDSTEG